MKSKKIVAVGTYKRGCLEARHAEVVIRDGVVVKDRYGMAPRRPTKTELAQAVRV